MVGGVSLSRCPAAFKPFTFCFPCLSMCKWTCSSAHEHIYTCKGLRLGIIFSCTQPYSFDAGSFNETQNLPILQVSLASLFWRSPASNLQYCISSGLSLPPDICMCSEDPNSGPLDGIAISSMVSRSPKPQISKTKWKPIWAKVDFYFVLFLRHDLTM